jgi:hypothetical protein
MAFISRSTDCEAFGLYLRPLLFLLAVFFAGDFVAEDFFALFLAAGMVLLLSDLGSAKYGRGCKGMELARGAGRQYLFHVHPLRWIDAGIAGGAVVVVLLAMAGLLEAVER